VVADVAKLAAGREDYYTRGLAADHEPSVSGHDTTTSDIRHWTQRSRERQGLPAHIADAAVLAKVAVLLGAQPPRLDLPGDLDGRRVEAPAALDSPDPPVAGTCRMQEHLLDHGRDDGAALVDGGLLPL
jgi:hypothetical protein